MKLLHGCLSGRWSWCKLHEKKLKSKTVAVRMRPLINLMVEQFGKRAYRVKSIRASKKKE